MKVYNEYKKTFRPAPATVIFTIFPIGEFKEVKKKIFLKAHDVPALLPPLPPFHDPPALHI